MDLHPNQFYHIYNRSNNQEIVFKQPENYLYFLRKMSKLFDLPIALLGYCLMPTHFHWLIHTLPTFDKPEKVRRTIGTLLSSYTKAINRRFNRNGSLFQTRTKAKLIDTDAHEQYPLTCLHYIHQNPLKAGLVDDIAKWPYSSYPDYAHLRNGSLPDIHRGYQVFEFRNADDFINKSDYSISDEVKRQLFL